MHRKDSIDAFATDGHGIREAIGADVREAVGAGVAAAAAVVVIAVAAGAHYQLTMPERRCADIAKRISLSRCPG